ncbi:MAG: hypothetical protein KKE76_15965 [Gammaproteobacteria bacterium]|nr:hypothetical protein [Gammaproteobacteria bacterium]
MDISRLSSSGFYPSSYPVPAGNRGARERALELVNEVATIRPVRESPEKIVQGEVLQRQRSAHQYSSTRDYLDSRLFDAGSFDAASADTGSRSNPGATGRVVGTYLSHTHELIQPDVNRGKQVDYFI